MADIDITRPVRTKKGQVVEIIEMFNAPILAERRQIVAMYRGSEGWIVNTWYADGRKFAHRPDELDLMNVHIGGSQEEPRSKTDMFRKIKAGEAIDLSTAPREGNYYVVDPFREDMDYCVLDLERWVWAIGRRKSDGAVHASLKLDISDNRDYECIWIR